MKASVVLFLFISLFTNNAFCRNENLLHRQSFNQAYSDAYLQGERLIGTYYYVRRSGGLAGETENYSPKAGDSIIISRCGNSDSLLWVEYNDCLVLDTKVKYLKFAYCYALQQNCWFLGNTPQDVSDFINQMVSNQSFQLTEDARDGYTFYYTRIDTFELKKPPVITGFIDGSRCGPGNVAVRAQSNTGTINWYDSLSGGSFIGSGSTYTATNLLKTTTFFAQASESNCISERVAVIASIKENCAGADAIFDLLKGRWYAVLAGTGTGLEVNRTPVSGDSVIVSNIPGSDSITGSYYHHCVLNQQFSYDLVYDSSVVSGEKTWMLQNRKNPYDRLNIIFSDTSVVLKMDVINGPYMVFERIDTFDFLEPPVVISTVDGARCGSGTVDLQANGTGTISWFEEESGGIAIAEGTGFTTPEISESTTYYVEAANGGCVTANRTAILATIVTGDTCTQTGMKNKEERTEMFSVYPNPAPHTLNIRLNKPGKSFMVEVYDQKGVLVYSNKEQGDILDLKKLKSGIYYVRAMADGYIETKKIVLE